MKSCNVAVVVLALGCSAASLKPAQSVAPPERVLEVWAAYSMPPGSYNQYIVREVAGRIEAYSVDMRHPSKRTPLLGAPTLSRFIDRVDSLITERLPGDTIRRANSDLVSLLCGDGSSFGARLTVASTVRAVGAQSCADNSPGSGARMTILQGIVDSLAALPRPR